MEPLNNVMKTSIQELEELLQTKTVVSDPIVLDKYTIIPLVSVGFGFGAGGGLNSTEGTTKDKTSGGAGGGGTIRPIAIIVIGPDGVRVEAIKSSSSGMEMLVEAVAKGMEKFGSDGTQ